MDLHINQEQRRLTPSRPMARLECSVSLDGRWVLRSFHNDVNIERITFNIIAGQSEASSNVRDASSRAVDEFFRTSQPDARISH